MVAPGAMGRTRSMYIMVSSTRVLRDTAGQGGGAAEGADAGARLDLLLVTAPLLRCPAGRTHCVARSISKPPLKPAPPNRLSDANRREPVLPGRKRFWSSCSQTYRSVSGELLVYRMATEPLIRFSAVSRVALIA